MMDESDNVIPWKPSSDPRYKRFAAVRVAAGDVLTVILAPGAALNPVVVDPQGNPVRRFREDEWIRYPKGA